MITSRWVAGFVSAIGLAALGRRLPQARRHQLSAAGLAGAALVYTGGASRGRSRRQLALCGAALLPFTAIAVGAIRADPRTAPRMLAAGWLLHAVWDWGHQHHGGDAVPSWYAEMCQGFDVALAGWLVTEFGG